MVVVDGNRSSRGCAQRRRDIRLKRFWLALAIPAAVLAAACTMRLLIARPPARLALDLAQPIAVVTNWQGFGAIALGILGAALALATAAYFCIIRSGPLTTGLTSPVAIATVVAASLACAWLLPVLFSSDVYAYAAYGELARLGANPYAHAPLARGNPIFDAAVVQWGNPPPGCVYGVVFVSIAAAIVGVTAPFGTLFALDGLRALSSIALIACTLFACSAYRGDAAERLLAAATIGLNPIAIWSAAEGHNDALALALVLAGYACARRGRVAIGAFIAAIAGGIKLPAFAAALPLASLGRGAWLGIATGIVAGLALSIPIFAGVVTQLVPHGHYAPAASFQSIVKPIGIVLFSSETSAAATAWVAAAVAAAACGIAGIRILRRRKAEGWTYLAGAGWLLIPNPYPWYALWLVAIAAAAPGTRGATALLLLAAASLLRYVPDAVAAPGPVLSVLLGAAATLPFVLLVVPPRHSAMISRSP
jgi:hypothetical protein